MLGHLNEVAGASGMHAGGERRSAALDISEMSIIAGEFLAQIDDGEIDEAAAGLAAVVFSGIHQAPAEALLLAQRIDGQKTKIGSFALGLKVDAAGNGI